MSFGKQISTCHRAEGQRDGLAQVQRAVLEMQMMSQDRQVHQHGHKELQISVTLNNQGLCFALSSEKLAWGSTPYHLQFETKDNGTASI